MGTYYYIKDKNSENGFTPVPEDDYIQAILRIAKEKGISITDKMIIKELENKRRKVK